MKFDFPIYAQTKGGKNVECWEWDADTERWVDTVGGRHRLEDLIAVKPPSDITEGDYRLPCLFLAITPDGGHTRLIG